MVQGARARARARNLPQRSRISFYRARRADKKLIDVDEQRV